nr:MAG TPA: hypothetical protein [Caudoviricetes sp.]
MRTSYSTPASSGPKKNRPCASVQLMPATVSGCTPPDAYKTASAWETGLPLSSVTVPRSTGGSGSRSVTAVSTISCAEGRT